MDQSIQFNTELINRYDKSGPRYTSYPTALELHTDFTGEDYQRNIAQSNENGGALSLYIHIPFCNTVCFYCACTKVVTNNRRHAEPYIATLSREIEMLGALFNADRPVNQLHWGGGTPTFLNYAQMRTLMAVIGEHFQLRDDDGGEYSIEIDPRETNKETIRQLRELGFNRISLGVQDFDYGVQKAVNRIQSEQQTFDLLASARCEGFRSTNIDLIYGLPLQTVESFSKTLDKVLAAAPERFSIFNYAHMPTRFKVQRNINEHDLPSPELKLAILQMIGQKMTDAGYVFIGMDHFAKPDDELAIAQRSGRLYRNFQGYSTYSDCDLIGLGVTSIGRVGNAYIQNIKELEEYSKAINENRLPVFKGLELTADDLVRRAVITQLICHFELSFVRMEQGFSICFHDYFALELKELEPMQTDGLLTLDSQGIKVLPVGRLLIRNICMVFDKYLKQKQQQQFSRVI
jgi:oxygen-independent coproporphyrinogen-3 oxidase